MSLVSIFLYLFFFAVGMGSQPWTVNSEIYPLHVRGTATSIATFANWVSNYVVAAIFLTTTGSSLGKVLTYAIIAFFCLTAFAFIYVMLPETKEKPLNEIVDMFLSKDKKIQREELSTMLEKKQRSV